MKRDGSKKPPVECRGLLLQPDKVVTQRCSVRRGSGGGKPAYVYELTPQAEDLFPKGYEPVLGWLLDVLAERLGLAPG